MSACAVMAVAGVSSAAAATPFNPDTPTVFIAQGPTTQLDSAVESQGKLIFEPIGANAGLRYNAIAFDTVNDYLYGVYISGPNAGDVAQIDAGGTLTNMGVNVNPGKNLEDVGAWDPANNLIYFGSSSAGANSLFVYNPATNSGTTLALSAVPHVADLTFAQGYLWGIAAGNFVRIDPTTGVVTDFALGAALSPTPPNDVFGAAWTYGNGELGFSNDTTGDIYVISIANAGTATPTFTPSPSFTGPPNNYNDGAENPGINVDLALSKTATPAAVPDGGQITYSFTVTNNGPGNSSGYQISDPLPPGLTNVQAPTGCQVAGGVLTCTEGPLAYQGTATISFTADAPVPNTSAITNTATVTGNENDPVPGNNSSSATVQPLPGADLAITKTASPTSTTAGGQVVYTLLVTNNGPDDASDALVSDALPAGETLVSAVPSQGSCSATSCQLGAIPNGGQAQILLTVDLASSATGTITNTATVSSSTPDPNPNNNSASAQVTVTPLTAPVGRTVTPTADLSIVKRVNHSTAAPGQMLTWTMVVTNHGPDPATDVTVTDTSKLGLADVTVKPSQGTCTPGHPLRCSLGTIDAGGTVTITVTGKVVKAGTEINTASVSSTTTDSTTTNNISHATTRVVAPAPKLGLTKTASPTSIKAGGTVSYRITVSASGATAKDLKVCDALPLGLTYVSSTPSASLSNGRECWTIPSLASGHSKTLTLKAKALTSTHGTLTNHATATATGTKTAHAEAKVTVTASGSGTPPAGGVTG